MADSRSTNRVFLVSSVVLGVVAMVAAFVYLENGAGQDRGPKSLILVARHDLRATSNLDPEKDLIELEIPVRMTELKTRSLAPDQRASYKGQRLNRDVLAGTPVMLADLAAAATLELRGDNRAMSIQVKGANALGGLLIPGDMVKLLVTRPVAVGRPLPPTTAPSADAGETEPVEAPSQARWETVSVTPTPFRVLAINQRLSRSRTQLTAGEQYQGSGESTSQQTVTLEVTEAQARTILEQTGGGQLPVTLLLCPAHPTSAPAGSLSN